MILFHVINCNDLVYFGLVINSRLISRKFWISRFLGGENKLSKIFKDSVKEEILISNSSNSLSK